MKRVAIYVRYGRDAKDTDKTIEQKLKSFIKKMPDWKCVNLFVDDGFSGLDKARPELNKMIAACEKGTVDIVLVESLKHISRDFMYASKLISDIKNLGVDIYSESTRQFLTNGPLWNLQTGEYNANRQKNNK